MLLSKTACIKFKLYILSVHAFQLRLIGKMFLWKNIWKMILGCVLLVSRCFQFEIFSEWRKSVLSFIRNRGMWIWQQFLFLCVLAHCSLAISNMSCRTWGKIVRITCCRYTWQNWSIQAKTGLVCELRTLPLTNELSSGKHMLSSNTQSSHFSMPITNESDILWNEERQKMNGILLLGPGLFFLSPKRD